MRRARSSAAYRIAFTSLGVLLLGLALLGTIVFYAMHGAFTRQLDATISDEARIIADEYRSGGIGELKEAIAEREASRSPTRMLYALFAPDGRRVLGAFQTSRPPLGIHDIAFIDPIEGPDSARGFAVDLSPTERLLVATDREWIERIDRTVLEVFGAAFLAACLMGIAGAVFLGNYLRQRLNAISGTAEAIIRGDIRGRMPVSGRCDEFDQLAITLNRMLDRIEGLLENLRQVSNDIAHDLRTPLAKLRNQLEEGAMRFRSGEPGAVIEDALERVDDVLSLFAAILRIAEVEAGETRRFFAPVDLSVLTSELAESYAPAIYDGGRALMHSVEPGIAIVGDAELLSQAAVNLLDNAQRHTPEGTVIRLTLVAADGVACLQVADNGPGIANSDLDRVVKRFARLERSRNTVGYGLGLNLVSAVAKLHGGRLKLDGNVPGLSVTIEIPRASGHAITEDRTG